MSDCKWWQLACKVKDRKESEAQHIVNVTGGALQLEDCAWWQVGCKNRNRKAKKAAGILAVNEATQAADQKIWDSLGDLPDDLGENAFRNLAIVSVVGLGGLWLLSRRGK